MNAPRKRKSRLRLFIWEGFSPDYTDGLAFAIASSESEARALVIAAYMNGCEPSSWGELTIHPLSRKIARAVGGGG